MGRPPLSRLRRRFGPLRGTQRRCAALRAAPQGRYAPHALRAQPFLEHEKKAVFLSRGWFHGWITCDSSLQCEAFPGIGPEAESNPVYNPKNQIW